MEFQIVGLGGIGFGIVVVGMIFGIVDLDYRLEMCEGYNIVGFVGMAYGLNMVGFVARSYPW